MTNKLCAVKVLLLPVSVHVLISMPPSYCLMPCCCCFFKAEHLSRLSSPSSLHTVDGVCAVKWRSARDVPHRKVPKAFLCLTPLTMPRSQSRGAQIHNGVKRRCRRKTSQALLSASSELKASWLRLFFFFFIEPIKPWKFYGVIERLVENKSLSVFTGTLIFHYYSK